MQALCDTCGRVLKVAESDGRRFLMCPHCGTSGAARSPGGTPKSSAARGVVPPPPRSRRGVAFAAYGIMGLAALAVASVVVVVMAGGRGKASDPGQVALNQPVAPVPLAPGWRRPVEPAPRPAEAREAADPLAKNPDAETTGPRRPALPETVETADRSVKSRDADPVLPRRPPPEAKTPEPPPADAPAPSARPPVQAERPEQKGGAPNARVDEVVRPNAPSPPAGRREASVQSVRPDGPRGRRVVLVELFTGAQCPPCVSADLAFDELGKAFSPAKAVRLEYHLHVPGPDPLTSPAALARQRFFGRRIEGTPTAFVNGRRTSPMGGARSVAADRFQYLCTVVADAARQPAKAAVKVSATRTNNRVEVRAEVSDVREESPELRLRLVLAESSVAYAGSNGIPGYQNVVREFPGGAEGTPVEGKAATTTATVDLDALRKRLTESLASYAATRPFPRGVPPLTLTRLIAVAFVQNDKTREVLQAAQAEVPE